MTSKSIFSRSDIRLQWLSEAADFERLSVLTAVIGPEGLAHCVGRSPQRPATEGYRGDVRITCAVALKGGYDIVAYRGSAVIAEARLCGPFDVNGRRRAQEALEGAGVRLLPMTMAMASSLADDVAQVLSGPGSEEPA